MTILISNMGETVVAWIKHGTISLARRTILPDGKHHLAELTKSDTKDELGKDVERLGEALEEGEKKRHGKEGETLVIRLLREVRKVAKDVSKKPPPKYHWDQWRTWLELLAEKDGKEKEGSEESSGESRSSGDHVAGDADVILSWLADNGPLFSDATESEWVLSRLCRRLEKVMADREA